MNTEFEIPVGTIVAYAADPGQKEHPLPENWFVCDGRSLNTTDYAELYAAIQYANGGSGGTMKIPNLQGRFIRGSNKTNLPPGSQHEWSTAKPTSTDIQVRLDMMGTNRKPTLKIAGKTFISWRNEDARFPVSGGDAETRPVNVYLHYIIKVMKGNVRNDVPCGAVFPYGGGDGEGNGNQPIFPHFLRCDGSSANKSEAGELFDVIGTRWSSDPTPGTTTVVAPNIAGQFIRGDDPTGKYDPDAGSRQPAPDGSGKGLGTWQKYATGLTGTGAYIPVKHFSDFSRTSTNVLGNRIVRDESYSKNTSWSGGDIESRPPNAAVHFYINSRSPTDQIDVFPIGSIIAIPGTPEQDFINTAIWQLCDGKSLSAGGYDELYTQIGKTWGYDKDRGDFLLPNLTGQYLRGADLEGRENGDPDRANRHSGAPEGASSGAGSFQNTATGIPKSEPVITINYPTATQESSDTTDFLTNDSAGDPKSVSFAMAGLSATESAPRTVAVRFYMRCK